MLAHLKRFQNLANFRPALDIRGRYIGLPLLPWGWYWSHVARNRFGWGYCVVFILLLILVVWTTFSILCVYRALIMTIVHMWQNCVVVGIKHDLTHCSQGAVIVPQLISTPPAHWVSCVFLFSHPGRGKLMHVYWGILIEKSLKC